MAGRRLEKYELLEEVGQGGMAVVYRALDTVLKREVAVKVLHGHLANEEESKQRFQREAQAVAKLRHDNILEIYDYSGLDSAESFIVTEFIHGQTLKAFIAKTTSEQPEIAAMIAMEIAKALGHAHELGVIHRDIKPENIMIRDDGRLKLTDFGIAQIVDVQGLTLTGQLLGSPAYMAPELVLGQPLDFRSDVYSLGTLLYQLATSKMPFPGRNPHEVLKRIADGHYTPAARASSRVDAKLGRIISKALARDPAQRYECVLDFQAALADYLADVAIERTHVELASYFKDPKGFEGKLQERCVAALLSKGRSAVDHGAYAEGLALFDRLLCSRPGHPEVTLLLKKLARRRDRKRNGIALGLFGVLGLGAWGVAAYFSHGPAPAVLDAGSRDLRADGAGPGGHQAPLPMDGTGATQDAGRTDTPASHDLGARDLRHRERATIRQGRRRRLGRRQRLEALGYRPYLRPTHRPNGLRPPATLNRTFEIVPRPKAVTIYLNQQRIGDYGPDLRVVHIPARSEATLTFRNDACCFQKVVTVEADTPAGQLKVRLPWKPGRVSVMLVPSVAADIAIGHVAARPGQVVNVHIPDSSSNGRTSVVVRVQARGFQTLSQRVAVRANGTAKLTLHLERAK